MKHFIKKILIAVDGGKCSAQAVKVGSSLAAELGAEILLIHVVNRPAISPAEADGPDTRFLTGLRRSGRSLLRRMHAVVGMSATCGEMLREGTPAQEVLNVAAEWGAQLVVLGPYSQARLAHLLLGSTAEMVARCSRCPVMTVAADFDGLICGREGPAHGNKVKGGGMGSELVPPHRGALAIARKKRAPPLNSLPAPERKEAKTSTKSRALAIKHKPKFASRAIDVGCLSNSRFFAEENFMETIRFNVQGMSCGGCVRHVTRALENVPGTHVQEVKVGFATVAIDPHNTSRESLVDALAKAGFKANEAAIA